MDQQVVRAALKSYHNITSTKDSSESHSMLSPSNAYLRLLLSASTPQPNNDAAWTNPKTSIDLLEWRAALMVKSRAESVDRLDASVDQRVSKAVSEAFVAAQVDDMIANLPLAGGTARIVINIFKLVSIG